MQNLFVLILALTICSCTRVRQENKSIEVPYVKVLNKGVEIDYYDCGEGEITILFVHGWCINQTYWSGQIEAFCNNYRVITIDMPGFGNSGKNRDTWTVEEFGKDVSSVIEQLGLKKVVLVGHSMGGDVILEAALNNPEQVVALIGVDNFKDVGIEYNDSLKSKIDVFLNMLRKDFRSTATKYAKENLFHPDTENAIVGRVINNIINSDPEIAVLALEGLMAYAPGESKRLSELRKTLYLINSDATYTYIEGLEKTGISFEILNIHATGHYPMIEKPEEFNQLLQEALQKVKENM